MSMRLTPGRGDQQIFKAVQRSLPRIAVAAANSAAFVVQAKVRDHMGRALDRPTPAVVRSVLVAKATPERPVATVYVGSGDPAFQARLNTILSAQEKGGTVTAAQVGRQSLSVPVPGAVPLNAYGALGRSGVKRLLGQKTAFATKAGVFRRLPGGKRKLLVLFRKQVAYRPRLGWHAAAKAAAKAAVPAALKRVMADAIGRRFRF